jgi:hypothetical protein
VRVELVEEQRAVELARRGDPGRELLAADQLAGRVARVREQERAEAAAEDLAPQVADGEGVAALALEQDRDGREQPEDVEQLLVGRVVGQEVAEVDLAERGGGARERGAAAAGDATFSAVYCDGMPRRYSAVVELGDRLAQLPQPGDRRVLLVAGEMSTLVRARRRAGQLAGLGHALAEVAPVAAL